MVDVILEKTLCLGTKDSKTNVCIPFSLEKDYRVLEFLCSYGPKNCDDEDLARRLIEEGLEKFVLPEHREKTGPWEQFRSSVVNLLTLSVDREGDYLGCAHRQHPEQRHIISAEFSSPGFFRSPPRRGNWRALINVHAVVSGEVRYHLQILGHEREGD
jgi:hypothetical protein